MGVVPTEGTQDSRPWAGRKSSQQPPPLARHCTNQTLSPEALAPPLHQEWEGTEVSLLTARPTCREEAGVCVCAPVCSRIRL